MFDQLPKQNEEMLKSMKSKMNLDAFVKTIKPTIALLELQYSKVESLVEEQTQLSKEMMADSLEEARAVCQCESIPELMEVQKNSFRSTKRKWLSSRKSKHRRGLRSVKKR